MAIVGTRGIPARYGGFETFAERLAVGLVARGVDVTVVCPRSAGPRPTRYRGVRLDYVPACGGGTAATLLYDLLSLWRACWRSDVVYMLGYASSVFCILPRLLGREVWINMDGLEWKRSKWRGLPRLWLRFTEAVACLVATRLIFDSAAVARNVLARHSRRGPSTVIAYGADVERERPDADVIDELGLAEGEYYLAVCRFEPENQVREIVEAYRASSCTRPLVLVTNDVESPYARETRALEDERVRFVGSVYEPDRLFALRAGCRAYVHGHTVGGTNPSLLESMACGVPVLAHDNPFNREVLGEAGRWFASPRELTTVFDAVETLPAGSCRREGAAARDRVLERYTWDAIVEAYGELLGADELRADELEQRGQGQRRVS